MKHFWKTYGKNLNISRPIFEHLTILFQLCNIKRKLILWLLQGRNTNELTDKTGYRTKMTVLSYGTYLHLCTYSYASKAILNREVFINHVLKFGILSFFIEEDSKKYRKGVDLISCFVNERNLMSTHKLLKNNLPRNKYNLYTSIRWPNLHLRLCVKT